MNFRFGILSIIVFIFTFFLSGCFSLDKSGQLSGFGPNTPNPNLQFDYTNPISEDYKR